MRRHLLAAVTLVALCAALLPATPAFAAPPANDDFADAAVISGREGRVPVNFDEATTEPGEPTYPGNNEGLPPRRSVWFRWTAPATAWYHFSVAPMDEDCRSTSPVFQGASLDSLVRRSHHSANDVLGTIDFSFVRAVKGQTYKIAAAGNCGFAQALVWEQRGPLILSVVRSGGAPVAGVLRRIATRIHATAPGSALPATARE